MNAIELLKADHEEVSALLQEFEEAEAEEQIAIAEEVCEALAVHAQIEEEIFYPAARDALGEEGEDLIGEAAVEHDTLRYLIEQIEDADEDDMLFESRVKVLGEYVKHHVREEENELFPKLRASDAIDLEALGAQMKDRKAELSSFEEENEAGEEELLADEEDEDDDEDVRRPGRGGTGDAPPARHSPRED